MEDNKEILERLFTPGDERRATHILAGWLW
jgi:hypothetical protein